MAFRLCSDTSYFIPDFGDLCPVCLFVCFIFIRLARGLSISLSYSLKTKAFHHWFFSTVLFSISLVSVLIFTISSFLSLSLISWSRNFDYWFEVYFFYIIFSAINTPLFWFHVFWYVVFIFYSVSHTFLKFP